MCSGVKTGALLVLGVYVLGCEDAPPLPSRELPTQEHLNTPAPLDAGLPEALLLDEALLDAGPMAPGAFSLAAEAEAFSTMGACLARNPPPAALVSDALLSLGIETLREDACHLLEAVHDKRVEPCRTLGLRALEHPCLVAVAVAREEPSACPQVAAFDPARGRDPLCLALASHRSEPCEALEASDAVLCRAALKGSRALCNQSPTAARRRTCILQVERWRGLAREIAGAPVAGVHATLHRTDGDRSFDDLARAGAVVLERGAVRRVVIDVARGRVRMRLRVRLSATGAADVETFELSEAGAMLAKASGEDLRARVLFDANDGGSPERVIVTLDATSETAAMRSFELVAVVRDRVHGTP